MTSPFRFDGRRIVLTGGATGVGAALLVRLEELGAEDLTVIDLVKPGGPHSTFIQADLSYQEQVLAAIGRIDGPIDALFNNAGVADTLPAPTVFAVNFLAMRLLTDGLLARMTPGSAIVNTGSIAAVGWPQRLQTIYELLDIDSWTEAEQWFAGRDDLGTPYGFTKECIQVYTLRMARSLSTRAIRINCAAPGPVDTPLLADFRETMTDAVVDWSISQGDGHLVTADEVATTLAFLASPAAAAINGLTIAVDRGFSAAMTAGQLDLSAFSIGA